MVHARGACFLYTYNSIRCQSNLRIDHQPRFLTWGVKHLPICSLRFWRGAGTSDLRKCFEIQCKEYYQRRLFKQTHWKMISKCLVFAVFFVRCGKLISIDKIFFFIFKFELLTCNQLNIIQQFLSNIVISNIMLFYFCR